MLMIRVVSLVALVAVALCNWPAAPARMQARGKDAHDQERIQCLDDGPKSSEAGYLFLGKKEFKEFPAGALFWHLNKFRSRSAANKAAVGKTGMVVEAEGRFWLFTFGPKEAAPKQGEFVFSVGPLEMTADELPVAKSYEVEAYLSVMPAGTHTRVHTHWGPEAWYVLEGEQCLETREGTIKAVAPTGATARPTIPMQLTNTGATPRRALSIVIHDADRPLVEFTDEWKPAGLCNRNP